MIKVKNNRNYWLSALCFLIFFINFPINSVSNTVLGESVFPAEIDDEFIWDSVNATESWYMEVDHIKKRFAAAFMRFSVNYYADLWEI